MEVLEIINLVAKIVKVAVDLTPTVIKTVEDAKPFAQAIVKSLSKGEGVSPNELEELEKEIDRLSNELQKPLPPEDESNG